MSRKKYSTTVYLEEGQVMALRHLSVSTGVPAAKFIRLALDHFLDEAVAAGKLPAAVMVTGGRVPESALSMGDVPSLEETVARVVRRLLVERASEPGAQAPWPVTVDPEVIPRQCARCLKRIASAGTHQCGDRVERGYAP